MERNVTVGVKLELERGVSRLILRLTIDYIDTIPAFLATSLLQYFTAYFK